MLNISSFVGAQNGDKSVLLCVRETAWELDLEFEDEIASVVIHHQWGKWVVVVYWHSFAFEDFLEFRCDDLVRSELNYFTFESLEFDCSGCESILEANLVSIHEVISDTSDAFVLDLIYMYDKVSCLLVCWLMAFPDEAKLGSWLHSWFNVDFFLSVHLIISAHSISHRKFTVDWERFGATVHQFFQSAGHIDVQVDLMCLSSVYHRVFVQVTLDFVQHLDLFSFSIKGDGEWVSRSKEDLEDLERITIEAVALDLSFSVYSDTID